MVSTLLQSITNMPSSIEKKGMLQYVGKIVANLAAQMSNLRLLWKDMQKYSKHKAMLSIVGFWCSPLTIVWSKMETSDLQTMNNNYN